LLDKQKLLEKELERKNAKVSEELDVISMKLSDLAEKLSNKNNIRKVKKETIELYLKNLNSLNSEWNKYCGTNYFGYSVLKDVLNDILSEHQASIIQSKYSKKVDDKPSNTASTEKVNNENTDPLKLKVSNFPNTYISVSTNVIMALRQDDKHKSDFEKFKNFLCNPKFVSSAQNSSGIKLIKGQLQVKLPGTDTRIEATMIGDTVYIINVTDHDGISKLVRTSHSYNITEYQGYNFVEGKELN
jgi:hypothetical protein